MRCGEPIGKQDQFAAAFGGFNLFEFLPDNKVDVTPINISSSFLGKLTDSMLVFFTGKTRSASKILEVQRKDTSKKSTNVALSRMAQLAYAFKDSIENEDLKNLCDILNENWHLKKNLSEGITNPFIEEIYETAISSGANSGKLLGAGAGGFMVFFAPPENHIRIKQSLFKLQNQEFRFENSGSKIIYE